MGNSLKNSILLHKLERHLRIQVVDGGSNTCSTQHVLWRVVEWLGESFVAVAVIPVVAVAVAMGSEYCV